MDNKILKSSIKAYCRELLETSTSGDAGGYLTKKAFRKPKPQDKNSPTGFESSPKPNMYTKTMKFKIVDPKDRLNSKDLWKGEHLEEIKVNNPSLNNYKKKLIYILNQYVHTAGEDHEQKLYNDILNSSSLDQIHDILINGIGFPHMVDHIEDQANSLSKMNESRYTQFKRKTSQPKSKEILHKAIKEIQMKLDEVNRLIEFTTRIKGELQENDQEIEYLKRTKDSLYKIQDKLKEAFSNISKINEIKVNTPISLDSLIKKYSSFPYNMKERDIIFHLQDHEDENVKSQVKNYIKNRVNKLT